MVTTKLPVTAIPPKQLDAWMDYQCYWIKGLETQICNFQGFIKHPDDIPLEFSLNTTLNSTTPQVDFSNTQPSNDKTVHTGKPVNVQMLNIHEGGMVFGTCSPVPIGFDIHIRVNLQGEELSLHGVVTHCIELDDHHCDVGVQFKEDNEHYAMRMIEQACHIEHYRKIWMMNGRDLSEDQAAKEWIEQFASSFPR